MKKEILLYITLQLTACVSIDNGSSISPKPISTLDLQGCFFSETRSSYSSLDNTYLYCNKMCFSNDTAYSGFSKYIGILSSDSTKFSISSTDTAYSSTGLIQIIEPEIDGVMEYNFKITNGSSAGIYKLLDSSGILVISEKQSFTYLTNIGWNLCK